MKGTGLSVIAAAFLAVTLLGPSARADALDTIKSQGKMVVAIDPTFEPYEFTDAQGGITGYDPALLALIAQDLGVKIEFQKMAFDGVIPGLIAGSFDFTCTALNVTAERAKRIAYTVPVSMSQNVVLKRAGDGGIASAKPEDLSGHTAAVKQATQPEQLLKDTSKALEAAGKKPINILSVQTVEQTIEAVSSKRADFVLDDVSVLTQVAAAHKGEYEIAGNLGAPVYIAWGTRKADAALNKYISDELKKFQDDGRMAALQTKFFGVSFKLPTSDFIPQ